MCFRGFVKITLTSVGYYSQYLSNFVSFFYLITDLENCRDLPLSDLVSGSYSASSIEFRESSCGPNAGIICDFFPVNDRSCSSSSQQRHNHVFVMHMNIAGSFLDYLNCLNCLF